MSLSHREGYIQGLGLQGQEFGSLLGASWVVSGRASSTLNNVMGRVTILLKSYLQVP